MSRIGKKAVTVPSGVTANVEGQTVKVKGPKGALQLVLHDDVAAKMDKGAIQIDPRSQTKRARSQWGTARTLVNNLMTDAITTKRWFFVVAMGRSAGHLAVRIGKAAGATLTVIAEELHVGTPGVFADAGLVEVSRPTARRLVMRLDF